MEIKNDPWLSSIFNYDVFRLGIDSDDPVSGQEIRQKILDKTQGKRAFIYTKTATGRVDLSNRLVTAGFNIVDVNVSFDLLPVDCRVGSPGQGITLADGSGADRNAVVGIAETCFAYTRFHLDPQISNDIANRVKRSWIENYYLKQRGECLRVAFFEGKPAGFLAVLAANSGGKKAWVIDLVGVARESQGKGIGRALVEDFIALGRERAEVLQVGTQAANIKSMRMYEACGFRLADTKYVLHLHL